MDVIDDLFVAVMEERLLAAIDERAAEPSCSFRPAHFSGLS